MQEHLEAFMVMLVEQVRMYYGSGKGLRNSCNSWLLQLLRALTPYAVQSLHANLFCNRQRAPLLVIMR